MICSGNKAFEYLKKSLEKNDVGESSHWKKYNRNFAYNGKNFTGLEGFGGNTKYSYLKQILSTILQKKYFMMSKNFKNFTSFLKKARLIAKNQDRIFDLDFLRQAITLSFLEDKIGKCNSTLVIGDGYASMTSLLIDSNFSSKIILINLNKQLMVDLFFIKKYLGEEKFNSSVALVTNEDDAILLSNKTNSFSIIAIQAENHSLVQHFDVDLVLNVVSMGEMNTGTVSEYFYDIRKLCRRNKNLYFYCCNRIEKKFPDGTVTKFSDYPWKKDDLILVDELCPWTQQYYSFIPPFYRNYDGPIIHQLRLMSK
jgi:putative sugar O-methyltransferase